MWFVIQFCASLGFLWAWFTAMVAFWRGWRDEPSLSKEADFDRGPIAVRRTFAVGASEWLPVYEPPHGGFMPVRFISATKALFVTGEGVRLRGSLEWSKQAVTVTIRHSWPYAFNRAVLLGMAFVVSTFVAGSAREQVESGSVNLVEALVPVAIVVAIERMISKVERRTGEHALTDLAARFRKGAA